MQTYFLFSRQRPLTKNVHQTNDGKFKIERSHKEFATVSELISNFLTKKDSEFPIKECLPPSEYGKSCSQLEIHSGLTGW